MVDLSTQRSAYAEELRTIARLQSDAIVAALARVPREHFLGSGPWQIVTRASLTQIEYETTWDPRRLYHNVLVAIDAARSLHNGEPAGLAQWIERLDLKAGERVAHIGCGTGYYTAILAELVGSMGRVTAVEIDPQLAERARTNLGPWRQVTVYHGDGGQCDPGDVDAIFVNAGVTHPQAIWLDSLRDGGRLLLPITATVAGSVVGVGAMFLIARQPNGFAATCMSPVGIYSCLGSRDPSLNVELSRKRGSEWRVQSVRRDAHEPDETCWLHRREACLSATALAASTPPQK
jgi:protein-L-isoaspartate(D-aspartate) O-methyltransferase